jgi:hypothetical protein
MRIRTGFRLDVIDVSRTGALAQGDARLLPGTHVDVHVTTSSGRTLVRSRVIRATVWQLLPDAVRYRVALAFDRPVPIDDGYALPDRARLDGAGGAGATHSEDVES